jgi:Holliday junction resolvase RusA-like endonuclease
MKKKVQFSIPGRLGGWKRAGRNVKQSFTPAKMRSDQGVVKHFASEQMRGKPLLVGPLLLVISVIRTPPKSWSKKKRAAASWITGTPDWDNTGKLFSDAMNGIVYHDDSQIAHAQVLRQYLPQGQEHISVHIEELEST